MATLAASGPISFSQIRSVMGGTGQVSMSAYRANSSAYLTRGVSGIPATGAINFGAFFGKARALLPGLTFRIFSGYFADDVGFFDRNTENNVGLTSNLTDISTGTNALIAVNGAESYSVEWFGYFYATVTGTWTWYTVSDDASYLWLGSPALSGYTTTNALVNNGGLHGMVEQSGSISLTADTYYPIRIMFGELGGGDNCQVSFIPPGGSRTWNGTGFYFTGLGTTSSFLAMNARILRALTNTTVDGPYWLNVNGAATRIFCLMNNVWDGGGWMMLLKATRGATFEFNSAYWTSANTLNETDLTRNDADAKYASFNSMMIKDVMALWPDAGFTGGSISQSQTWSWLVNNFFSSGTRTTAITGFSTANSRDSPVGAEPSNFGGFSTNIWSSQPTARRHVFGGGSHLSASRLVRWGFLFNEDGATTNFASSDAFGGIGMNNSFGLSSGMSGGDYYFCCGSVGLNRTMRVELFGR